MDKSCALSELYFGGRNRGRHKMKYRKQDVCTSWWSLKACVRFRRVPTKTEYTSYKSIQFAVSPALCHQIKPMVLFETVIDSISCATRSASLWTRSNYKVSYSKSAIIRHPAFWPKTCHILSSTVGLTIFSMAAFPIKKNVCVFFACVWVKESHLC